MSCRAGLIGPTIGPSWPHQTGCAMPGMACERRGPRTAHYLSCRAMPIPWCFRPAHLAQPGWPDIGHARPWRLATVARSDDVDEGRWGEVLGQGDGAVNQFEGRAVPGAHRTMPFMVVALGQGSSMKVAWTGDRWHQLSH
jgi:hypothetical protein